MTIQVSALMGDSSAASLASVDRVTDTKAAVAGQEDMKEWPVCLRIMLDMMASPSVPMAPVVQA